MMEIEELLAMVRRNAWPMRKNGPRRKRLEPRDPEKLESMSRAITQMVRGRIMIDESGALRLLWLEEKWKRDA